MNLSMRSMGLQRGFTTAETVLLSGFLAVLTYAANYTNVPSQSLQAQDLVALDLSPCELVHAYALLGEDMALTLDNLQEMGSACTTAGHRALAQTTWSSKRRIAQAPSAPVAQALEAKMFTPKQWAHALDPTLYPHASGMQDITSHRFSFWQYNDWYWETNAKWAKDNPDLLVNQTHAQVLVQKQRIQASGLGQDFSAAPK